MKKITISIGIPTYEAGESLITTLNSIYDQTFFNKIDKVLLVVDGNKISKSILNKIKNDKLVIKIYKKRAGQATRINDILKNLNTDFIILANDDVYLKNDAIEFLYKNTKYDLIAGCVTPLESKGLFPKFIVIGTKINHLIALNWKKGDNYLSCNGRLLMISKKLKQKLIIPKTLWNNDAYIYLTCKINNFKFKHLESAICFYQAPQTVNDHLKQSSKFQKSLKENSSYLGNSINKYYKVPINIKTKATIKVLADSPIYTSFYLLVAAYSRILTRVKNTHIPKLGYWDTDRSTKVMRSY